MESTQNTEAEKRTEPTAAKHMSGTTIAIIVVILLALLGAGYLYFQNRGADAGLSFGALFGANETETNGPVARVNGEEISRDEYNEAFENLRGNLEAQGADLSNPELQSQMSAQVVNSLIETELLRQAAAANSFTATDEDVQQEYDALAAQLGGVEALTSQMATVGLTDDELRSDIRDQIAIRAYLRANLDETALAVSDEEITAYYDEVDAQSSEELPPLAEVRDQIEQQLRLQKEQSAIAALIASLRAGADVEILM